MASKIRIILQTSGDVWFNGRAMRRLENVGRDYGLQPPAEIKERWKRAVWVFEHWQRGGSSLKVYRVRRGHAEEQWHGLMKYWGVRKRVTPPPRPHPRPQPNRGRLTVAATPRVTRPIAFAERSANVRTSGTTGPR